MSLPYPHQAWVERLRPVLDRVRNEPTLRKHLIEDPKQYLPLEMGEAIPAALQVMFVVDENDALVFQVSTVSTSSSRTCDPGWRTLCTTPGRPKPKLNAFIVAGVALAALVLLALFTPLPIFRRLFKQF